MGAPNSNKTAKDLFRILLRGGQPRLDYVEATFGVIFLEAKLAAIKPYIEYLYGQKNLEDLWVYEYEIEDWKRIVDEHGLTGTKCLGLVERDIRGHQQHLFVLIPLSTGASPRVEVFLTRNGEWLVFDTYEGEPRISRCKSVESLNRRLRSLERRSNSKFVGSHEGGSPLLAIALYLDRLVEKTLIERLKATQSLQALRRKLKEQSAMIGQ